MSNVTNCDIYRDGVKAIMTTDACSGDSPLPECSVIDAANNYDRYFRLKYKPSLDMIPGSNDNTIHNRKLKIIQEDINKDISTLRKKYGDIVDSHTYTWNGLTKCKWHANGAPGGLYNNEYFKRNDLLTLGYQPRPIFNLSFLDGIPAVLTSNIPIWMDRIFNPGLAVIFIILVFILIIYIGYKYHKKILSLFSSS